MSKQEQAWPYKFYYSQCTSKGVPYLETVQHSCIEYGVCRDGYYILTDGEMESVLSDLLEKYKIVYVQFPKSKGFTIYTKNAVS